MKIVLAYSGSLDTSVLLSWIKEKYDAGPKLQVELSPDFYVRLFWPAGALGYGLEFADQLSPINFWQRVADPPSVVGSQNTLTIDATASPTRFYRLRKF